MLRKNILVTISACLLGNTVLCENVTAGWLDDVKQRVAELKDEYLADNQSNKIYESQRNFLPATPQNWRQSIQIEPIFNSEVFIVEAGSQSNETVILVHGLGQAGVLDWEFTIPALANNYHVIALDLPGFGRSAAPPGQYSPTNYAKIISWLKQRYSEAPVTIIGHSMGGAITLRYSSLFPEEVANVILVDAAGILQRTAFVKHATDIEIDRGPLVSPAKKWVNKATDLSQSIIEFVINGPDPTDLLKSNEALWNMVFSDSPNANAGLAMIEEDFTSAIYNFSRPIHIIWGEEDAVAPPRTGHLLAHHLKNATLTTIPEAGHVPMKSHTLQFNDILLSALSHDIKPTPPPKSIANNPATGTCKNEHGKQFSGTFKEIQIENCTDVRLTNLNAEKITLKHSIAELHNVELTSSATALYVKESVVRATNLDIQAEDAIYSKESRLDLAGAIIIASGSGIRSKGKSRVIISVSQITSPEFTGDAHGDFQLENELLVD